MINNMHQFTPYTGIIAPLNIANIDTDAIIPKQFLQATDRINFGKHLFFNWRFIEGQETQLNPNFILNKPCYQNASILLTQRNFGCGSSREHAVWALIDYGFSVIIAPSFADIFYKNSFNNRLLLVTLLESEINSLFTEIERKEEKISCSIHLIKKAVTIKHKKYFFNIKDIHSNAILKELDNITLTLQHEHLIKTYENQQPPYLK